MKKTALSLILFALLGLAVQKASAQETIRTFTISPPSIEVSVNPGERKEGSLKIINGGTTDLSFTATTQDFIVKDENGVPEILPPNTVSNKYSGASWLAIYPSVIEVPAGKKVEVSYFIQVPGNAKPGGHYAAVVYTPKNTIGVKGTGSAVNTSVGTLFLLTVKGPVSFQARVKEFISKGFYEFGPATIKTNIVNNSDVHIKPTGNITLTNMLGGKSDVVKFPENNIFPGMGRISEAKVGKGLMLGRYKAMLQASYGPDKAPLVASVYFWVFPIRLVLLIVLTVAAIIAGYWYWKKDKGGKVEEPGHEHETPEEHQAHS